MTYRSGFKRIVALAFFSALPGISCAGLVNDPYNPCNASAFACPIPVSVTSGSTTVELVNNSFTSTAPLEVAFSMSPEIASGTVVNFNLTGTGSLLYEASATLFAYLNPAGGMPTATISATNYGVFNSGSNYIGTSTTSASGLTLSETVQAFKGNLAFSIDNESGSPVALVIDLSNLAPSYGYIDITNAYTLAASPNAPMLTPIPASGILFATPLIAIAAVRMRPRRKGQAVARA